MPPLSDIILDPILPKPLIYLIGGLLLFLTIVLYRSLGDRINRLQRALLLFFRLAAVILLVLILLQPSQREEKKRTQLDQVTLVALDTSESMAHPDAGNESRLDLARQILDDAQLLAPSEDDPKESRVALYQFDEDARRVALDQLSTLDATGPTTHFHQSTESILDDIGAREANALIFLSDGHDFEMVSPSRTALLARSRRVPVYAIPIGSVSKVRDISVRISNYQPYSYINQTARLTAILRVIGCEYEQLQVQLLRANKIIDTRQISTGEEPEVPIEFTVTEPEVGQYEYEIRVKPVENENDTGNNSAITYLNVIDEKIRALILEGAPYWDTTFLQRSLFENDKIDLDVLVQFTADQTRPIRNDETRGPLTPPREQKDFNQYDAVILGRSLDTILPADTRELLKRYVEDYGGILVFARGRAFEKETPVITDLEPIIWDQGAHRNIQVKVARDGLTLAPFRTIRSRLSGTSALPPLLGSERVTGAKSLAATLLEVEDPESAESFPGIVHRRYGKGQVLSVGVAGLWRWGFNNKVEKENSVFDAFWDQLLIWLLSRSELIPNQQFSFRASTANLLLGDKIYFRLAVRDPTNKPAALTIPVFNEQGQVSEITLEPTDTRDSYIASFVPQETGRYYAQLTLTDGTEVTSKFMVYEERLEATEIATDIAYLRKICQDSGGRLLTPDELNKLSLTLATPPETDSPRTRLVSLWDTLELAYLITALLAIDWFLRRRWGLL